MRKFLLFPFLLIILSACGNSNTTVSSESTKDTTKTTTSSTKEEYNFSVNSAKVTYTDDSKVELSGTGEPNTEVIVYIEDSKKEVARKSTNYNGNYTISFDVPDSATTYLFINGNNEISTSIYSKDEYINRTKTTKSSTPEFYKEKTVEKIDTEDPIKLLPYQEEGISNSEEYPADVGSMLYDKDKRKFTGMNYFFEGEIIGFSKLENFTSGEAWLVKNSNGYVMPIEYSYFSGSVGDSVKVWGTLSGLGYSSSDLETDNVVGIVGSMHAMGVELNGETQY